MSFDGKKKSQKLLFRFRRSFINDGKIEFSQNIIAAH